MSRKIKVAFLVDVFADVGAGAERQLYETLKRINRDRFEPLLFVLHQDFCPKEMEEFKIFSGSLGLKKIYDFKGIREGFRFARFAREEKIDIVVTYHFASDIWGTVFSRLGGVPVVISSRRDVGFWRKGLHVKAYRFVNRWVTRIVAVSGAVREVVLDDEGVRPDKVEVVYNGVDLSRFARPAVPLGSKTIGCIGNFSSPTKGHIFLVEAAKIVLDRHPEVRFVFVGDGYLKPDLVKRAQELGVEERLQFLGKRSDIPSLLAGMDICVLPSLSEGLSNALIEYMAAGRPVVATAVGGNVEVIKDGVNGFLVSSKDPAALAIAIMKLLGDPALAERLGREARATVEMDFDVEKQIKKLEALLEGSLRS